MNEKSTNNSMLYFMVGGLLVAVLAIGYFVMNRDGDSHTDTVVIDTVEDVGTNFKLDVGKDGGVSGTIEKKQAYQAIKRGPG